MQLSCNVAIQHVSLHKCLSLYGVNHVNPNLTSQQSIPHDIVSPLVPLSTPECLSLEFQLSFSPSQTYPTFSLLLKQFASHTYFPYDMF